MTYQVALSFAGQQRPYVERVAKGLYSVGVKVFYDEFETVTLWGKDGAEYFHEVYANDTSAVVIFVSRDYENGIWTRHEKRSALSRALHERQEYILPVRFDDTELSGIPSTTIYLSAQKFGPEEIASLILRKIGFSILDQKASDVPPPSMTAMSGEVEFDYSSFNGRFILGSGAARFETKWSKASDHSIHIYNDPDTIHGVAIAKGATEIAHVRSATNFDFTSRARCPEVGEVVVLRNTSGLYAAIKILNIADDRRDAPRDSLRFAYLIQSSGTDSFS